MRGKYIVLVGAVVIIGMISIHNNASDISDAAVAGNDSLIKKVSEINPGELLKKGAAKGIDFLQYIGAYFGYEKDAEETDIDVSNSEEASAKLEEYSLVRVVDGDTIIVSDEDGEYKVRFIGIDTPESVHSDVSKNNEYGQMASEYTKELLKDTDTVYLQYDVSDTDIYGRKLAYVWLNEYVDVESMDDIQNYMVNAILVKDGYAYDKVYEPNSSYADIFQSLREDAENNQTGLWEYQGFSELW